MIVSSVQLRDKKKGQVDIELIDHNAIQPRFKTYIVCGH